MKNIREFCRKGAVAATSTYAMAMTTVLAHAGVWDGASGTITNILNELSAALKSIVVTVATVVLIFCFIMMMISQSQKKVEMYRTWCITIFICIVAIYAVPFIINLGTLIGSQFH